MTLYTHAGDSATSSTCTGACATAWPPIERPADGRRRVIGQLGTLTRADGTTGDLRGPAAYPGKATKPGDVTGNGVVGFKVATVGAAAPPANPSVVPPAGSSSGGYRY
jgi:predicted lipoprotein with Yx(FWY)xxD motif